MKYEKISQKDAEELESLLNQSREELRSMRFDLSARKLYTHRDYQVKKKDVARILTALNNRSNV